MKFRFSEKKWVVVIGSIFFLVIAIWAVDFYLYFKNQPKIEEKAILDCQDVGSEAFLVSEKDGKTIIEGKSDGVRLEIPGDWKMVEVNGEKELDFYDSSAKFDNPIENAKNGACAIAIQSLKCNKITEFLTYADQARAEIGLIKEGKIVKTKDNESKSEIFTIGQQESIKYTYEKDGEIRNARIWIPINDSVYVFDSGIIFDGKCVDKFNEIIKTLSVQ